MRFVVLAATFLNLGQASNPANDFGFRLEYGMCTTDTLDTFQGVFVRDLGSAVSAISMPLALSQGSLDVVYRAITAAQFFEYPSDFLVRPPTNCFVTPTVGGSTVSCGGGSSAFAPANHYRLEVRNAGLTHVVSWHDNIAPSTDEANRLRNMFARIIDLIRRLPQVQRLPGAGIGCA